MRPVKKQQNGKSRITDEVKKLIKDFYKNDMVSYQSLNFRDCIRNGQLTVNRRFIIITLKEAFGILLSQHPDIKLNILQTPPFLY